MPEPISPLTGTVNTIGYMATVSRDPTTGNWVVSTGWDRKSFDERILVGRRDVIKERIYRAIELMILTSSTTNGDVRFHEAPSQTRERILDYIINNALPGGCGCESCWNSRVEDDENEGVECSNCQDLYTEDDGSWYRRILGLSDSQIFLCEYCRDDNTAYCNSCEETIWLPTRSYIFAVEECRPCYDERPQPIYSWDYRPPLNFHPIPPEEKDGPLYIGMELEVSFRDRRNGEQWATQELGAYEDLLYCKEDSSVRNGFEVVTHPMQPSWAAENFPFAAFQRGIENYGMLLNDDSTGTHIHMNKDAFTPAHLWKFLQIHMKLPEFCGIVGGRGQDATYGSFNRYSRNFLGVDRQQLLELAKKKGKFDNGERYIAVNLRNEYTLEMRYMRGGTAPKEIKKNIQWAKALYDFSGYLDLRDVREGALANAGYLLWYIGENRDEFPHLYDWIQERIPQPTALRERSN